METELLYAAIAGMFATLVGVFWKWIADLQSRITKNDAFQERIAPILERQTNMLETALEEIRRSRERERG